MPKHTSGRRPQHYGINEYMPRTMFGQLTYPLRGARQYVGLWRHPIKATKLGFRGLRKLLRDIESLLKRSRLRSSALTRECAAPSSPARPVRPIRWT